MEKIELIKLYVDRFLILIFMLLAVSCKSQINIFADVNGIKPTHSISNNYIADILDSLYSIDDFSNWQKSSKKLLLISSVKQDETILFRVIPTYREKYAVPLLSNNYNSYFKYKDVFIIYWGKELGLKKNKDTSIQLIFNDKELRVIKNGEYYGCEFILNNHSLTLKKKSYFEEILLRK
ncbi:hypothetical protein [Mesonia aquimarina]|uniref:hypothetical protein n=1 Tax=Mesonia aquimarina TaxID=1504967 RepID=UPI0013CECE6D|nr:hypothetical protein [Mesonia aquimarina]